MLQRMRRIMARPLSDQPRPSGSGGTRGTMKEEPRELPPVSLHGVVLCLRRFFCRHAFALRDLKLTGIPEPDKPGDGASYEAWLEYHRQLSEGPHNTQRVEWPCAKCGKVFRAHCGLDISPEHGPVLPDSSRTQNPKAHDLRSNIVEPVVGSLNL